MRAKSRPLRLSLVAGALVFAGAAPHASAQLADSAGAAAPTATHPAWRTPPCAKATRLTVVNTLPEDVDVVEIAAAGRRQTLIQRVGTGTFALTVTPKPQVEYAVRPVNTAPISTSSGFGSLAVEPHAQWSSPNTPHDRRVQIARACVVG